MNDIFDDLKPVKLDLTPKIKAWSFSRWKNHSRCPHSLKLQVVDKLKGPVKDEDHPAERGSRVHTMAEDYIKGTLTELPAELKKFENKFNWLQGIYQDQADILVDIEQDWGFNDEWIPTGWFDSDVWVRIKLDVALEFLQTNSGLVIDWKTGKKWGNEVSHTMQAQLYALAMFIKHPDLKLIDTEMVYLDEGKIQRNSYHLEELPALFSRWSKNGFEITRASTFPPKPNRFNCRFCDFGIEKGTGECGFAVPWS